MPLRDASCSCTRDASSSSKRPCCSILCKRLGLIATCGAETLLFPLVWSHRQHILDISSNAADKLQL